MGAMIPPRSALKLESVEIKPTLRFSLEHSLPPSCTF
jgi:hypothetical protein